MSKIDVQDLALLQESFRQRLWAAGEALCEEIVSGLDGRQIQVIRMLKGPGGLLTRHEVDVTVTAARIAYDDELILIGTFTHPLSGKPQDIEVSTWTECNR